LTVVSVVLRACAGNCGLEAPPAHASSSSPSRSHWGPPGAHSEEEAAPRARHCGVVTVKPSYLEREIGTSSDG